MKRRTMFAALAAGIGLIAAGCGSSSDDDAATTAAASAEAVTTVAVVPETNAAETDPAETDAIDSGAPFKIAIITPSAENDVAFSQSMYEAVDLVAEENDGLEISKSPNLFVVDDAATAIRDYADKGYQLIIAHGSQYGALLQEIAPQFPEVSFAWGTAADTFGQPNVFSYEAFSDQGGYVLGVIASQLSNAKNIGVIGPVEVGDAKLYVEGFKKGVADTAADVTTSVSYTGSFSDVALFAQAATTFTTGGADVITGTSQAVAGAVPVAEQSGAAWFGTQWNQTSLSSAATVASQVYHWEDAVSEMITAIEGGTLGGTTYSLTLENGGLQIEYNPDYPLDASVKAMADEAVAAITAGSITTTG